MKPKRNLIDFLAAPSTQEIKENSRGLFGRRCKYSDLGT